MKVCFFLSSHGLNLQVLVADVVPGPPPWKLPSPVVSFINTMKCDSPPLQLQLALEHVAQVYIIMPQLTAWRKKPAVSLIEVMDVLSPCLATSPWSALLPSCPSSAVGILRNCSVTITHYESVCHHKCTYRQRGLLVVSTMLSQLACGWTTVRRGRLPSGWRGLPLDVVCHHMVLSVVLEEFVRHPPFEGFS
ncbi:hypothetical protein E2C01_066436 [Portunus trituberculatus]|uniref:Uncharacterized protein n=1 Tax=Portunus trituberculatus TaxID=210409 RepID=A0A5B7HLI0_PORTR|nr:hypothetical protein [Portunus trituberculatus]